MNRHMKLKITLLIMAFLLLVAAIVYIMAPSNGQKTDSYIPGFSLRDENQPNSGTNSTSTDTNPSAQTPEPCPLRNPSTPISTPSFLRRVHRL